MPTLTAQLTSKNFYRRKCNAPNKRCRRVKKRKKRTANFLQSFAVKFYSAFASVLSASTLVTVLPGSSAGLTYFIQFLGQASKHLPQFIHLL